MIYGTIKLWAKFPSLSFRIHKDSPSSEAKQGVFFFLVNDLSVVLYETLLFHVLFDGGWGLRRQQIFDQNFFKIKPK